MDSGEHYCNDIANFPVTKFLQIGTGKGKKVLIVGESPAPNGWRKSGKAFYTPEGKLLPSGKNLNKLLEKYSVTVEDCSFTELVKCYVGKDRKLLNKCGARCWNIFLKQIVTTEFKLIILLGVKTLEIFNRESQQNLRIGELVNVLINKNRYHILPIYHPSPIAPFNHIKNVQILSKLNEDIKLLIN